MTGCRPSLLQICQMETQRREARMGRTWSQEAPQPVGGGHGVHSVERMLSEWHESRREALQFHTLRNKKFECTHYCRCRGVAQNSAACAQALFMGPSLHPHTGALQTVSHFHILLFCSVQSSHMICIRRWSLSVVIESQMKKFHLFLSTFMDFSSMLPQMFKFRVHLVTKFSKF